MLGGPAFKERTEELPPGVALAAHMQEALKPQPKGGKGDKALQKYFPDEGVEALYVDKHATLKKQKSRRHRNNPAANGEGGDGKRAPKDPKGEAAVRV